MSSEDIEDDLFDIDLERAIPEPPYFLQTIESPKSKLEIKLEQLEKLEEELDHNVVTWDGPDDPANPLNFTHGRRLLIVLIVSSMTFISPFASSTFAPGVRYVMTEFHNDSSILSSFIVSIYVLGFAVGPLFIAPLSEMQGRSIIYKISSFIFTLLMIGCSECRNMGSLLALQFVSGLVGSSSIALGSGSITDVSPQHERGKYVALYSLGPVLGPAIGPVIGGVLSSKSWRWSFRLVAILSGILFVVIMVYLPETYAPFVLKRKAKKLRAETNNPHLHTIWEDHSLGFATVLRRSIIRPLKLLVLSPIVSCFSLLVAFGYGQMYLMLTTFTHIFQTQYKMSTSIVGLAYLGLGLGSIGGLLILVLYSDKMLISLAAKSATKEMRPEYRLPLTIFLMPLGAIGLIIYGWGVYYKVHWMVPEIGCFIFGLYSVTLLSVTISYLVDAYPIYAASAASASSMMRSLGGGVLPLAGPSMYSALGYGWGNTLLALLTIVMFPIPVILYYKGEWLRKKFNPSLA
ncbi:major facilitator superfamily domain-containing protein [Lipomyces japonicus]|uniref:major facilitator superfamily domain-containing protein n=1 Tax=Lipomyces japonicus TaxID=56871 RepID=UPI0034CE7EC4